MGRKITVRNGILLMIVFVLMGVLLIPQSEIQAAGSRYIHKEDGVSYVYDADDQPVKNKWSEIDGKWYMTNAKGAILKARFITKGGSVYYLGKDGAMVKGRFTVNSVDYISSSETGALYNKKQWVKLDGEWYLVDSESQVVTDQLVTIDGSMYYVDSKGQMKTGVIKVGKDSYFAGKNGKIRTAAGWVSVEKKWYYVQKGGKFLKNSVIKSKNKNYYVGSDGSLSSGLAKVDGVITFFNSSGSPGKKSGWFQWNKKWYFLDKGIARTNSTAGSGAKMYYLGSAGTPVQGIYKVGDKYYYFGVNGKVRTKAGWVEYNKKWYYVDKGGALKCNSIVRKGSKSYYMKEDGKMATGIVEIDGSLRYIDDKGVIQKKSGWIKYQKNWYFAKKNGILCANSKSKIYGKFYYFDKKGVMQYGFIKADNGTAYYAKKTGVLVTNKTFSYKGVSYYADPSGVILLNGVATKAQGYSSSSEYLLMVDLTNQKTFVFKGKKDDWKLTKEFTCSTGTSAHPTPEGEYNTTMRTRFFNSFGYRCWWATGFIGGEYLFHSSPYTMSDEPKVCADSTMGVPSSHGCIRMRLEDALWIYNNIPIGTHLVIFK